MNTTDNSCEKDPDYDAYIVNFSPQRLDPVLYELLTDQMFVTFCCAHWIFYAALEKTGTGLIAPRTLSLLNCLRCWYAGEPLFKVLTKDSANRVMAIKHLLGNHGRFIFRPSIPNDNLHELLLFKTGVQLSIQNVIRYLTNDEEGKRYLAKSGLGERVNEVLVIADEIAESFVSGTVITLE